MNLRASGEYASRYRRLLNVLDFAKDRAAKDLEDKIEGLEDHKGTLTVSWKEAPSESERRLFSQAWETVGEEPGENIEHVVVGEDA